MITKISVTTGTETPVPDAFALSELRPWVDDQISDSEILAALDLGEAIRTPVGRFVRKADQGDDR
jgi:hypothetical protein